MLEVPTDLENAGCRCTAGSVQRDSWFTFFTKGGIVSEDGTRQRGTVPFFWRKLNHEKHCIDAS